MPSKIGDWSFSVRRDLFWPEDVSGGAVGEVVKPRPPTIAYSLVCQPSVVGCKGMTQHVELSPRRRRGVAIEEASLSLIVLVLPRAEACLSNALGG